MDVRFAFAPWPSRWREKGSVGRRPTDTCGDYLARIGDKTMKHSTYSASAPRSGTVMIVVMGLITIMLGLLLSMTMQVRDGVMSYYNYQSNVQYWIHLKLQGTVLTTTTDTTRRCTFCPH